MQQATKLTQFQYWYGYDAYIDYVMLHIECLFELNSFHCTLESFIVCQNYSPPEGYVPTMANPLLDFHYSGDNQLTGPNRTIVPFIACGDLR
jgi:tRNA (cytidine32/guanosine34-2'-O)-methyltransferase